MNIAKSSNLAFFVILTFLLFITCSPMLTSCGGSSSSDEDATNKGGDVDVSSAFGAVQTATSDSSGQLSITGSASNVQINLTLTDSMGNAVEGLSVDYIEAGDASTGMLTIYDPNDNYQTAVINLDSEDLSASTSVDSTKEPLTFLAVAAVVGAAWGLYSSLDSARTIVQDFPQVRYTNSFAIDGRGRLDYCAKPNTIMAVGDVSLNLATAGQGKMVAKTGKRGIEVVGATLQTIAPDLAPDLIQNGITYYMESEGVDPDEEVCVTLFSTEREGWSSSIVRDVLADTSTLVQSNRWSYVLLFSNQTCTPNEENTSVVCDGITVSDLEAALPSVDDFDGDGDGYTPNQNDCNDADRYVNPDMVEICGDGVDNDCSGEDATCAAAGTISTQIVSPGYLEGQCGGTYTDGVCYGEDRALYIMATVTGNYSQPATIAINGRQSSAYIDNTDLTSSDNMMILKCDSSGAVNKMAVGVQDASGNKASDIISYGCSAAASGLLVMLTWDAGDSCATDTDLDLYVKEPGNDVYAYDGGGTTSNGGSVTGDGVTCYGPVYYVINESAAPAGDYQIRVHYKSGSTQPAYTLRIVTDENFDYLYWATGTLSTANAAAGGTANFTSSNASWTTDTWTVSKNSDGEWSIPTTE